jgi:hypothetical protein
MLHQLGCLLYSPPLESHIRRRQLIKSGSKWEMELRGTSIWCVELIRQEIERTHPETRMVYSTGNSSTFEVNIDEKEDKDVAEIATGIQGHEEKEEKEETTEEAAEQSQGNGEREETTEEETQVPPAGGENKEITEKVTQEPQENVENVENVENEEPKATTTSKSSTPKLKTISINAILIDFFLYDTMKELENGGQETIPHHRTRSIWY